MVKSIRVKCGLSVTEFQHLKLYHLDACGMTEHEVCIVVFIKERKGLLLVRQLFKLQNETKLKNIHSRKERLVAL